MSNEIGKHRQEYLQWLRVYREKSVKQAADKYAALPPNIQAAIAKVAGVGNARLDELGAGDRRKMKMETKRLITSLVTAHGLLLRSDFTPD